MTPPSLTPVKGQASTTMPSSAQVVDEYQDIFVGCVLALSACFKTRVNSTTSLL
jgi:hypothetical protein